MTALSRRSALALTGSGITAALSGVASSASASAGDIEALYARWLAFRNRDYDAETEAECEASHAQYVALQNQIVAQTPTTARELALQYFADTDFRESDPSDAFEALITRLAGDDGKAVAS